MTSAFRQPEKIVTLDRLQPLLGFCVEQMQFTEIRGNDDLVAGAQIKALSYRRNEVIRTKLRGDLDLSTGGLDENDLSGNGTLSDCEMLMANAVDKLCTAFQ
ncbi:hypothetical protein BA011_24900 (plasmid) [Rhizobium leguminosarum]|uniref:Uncharacterized protein n=1 Tax=Rhizobium leguminosarum TaxID=384 RepID=A0A1B1CH25_RHILE|nr:hypothetical protein BA011_24900 [Rhizobium leguminosarum]